MATGLPWILNVDLELRIHKSLALYAPRKSEQRIHRGLILRLARRAADAAQRKPPPPGEPPNAGTVGRPSGSRPSAFVLEDAEEQALVLRALRADRQAASDPVVVEFLGRWGLGPEA